MIHGGRCTNVIGVNEGSMVALITQNECIFLFSCLTLIDDLLGTVFDTFKDRKSLWDVL